MTLFVALFVAIRDFDSAFDHVMLLSERLRLGIKCKKPALTKIGRRKPTYSSERGPFDLGEAQAIRSLESPFDGECHTNTGYVVK